ncbi:hypothetical protein [Bavariicoccus seileri]|uniref:hypothetical protein n=1 Tax=Bavariicoccus seileri TaxID=549685 RepID=UPI0003B50359|nr:hypothetical protein [Bavariicoccus seileri]
MLGSFPSKLKTTQDKLFAKLPVDKIVVWAYTIWIIPFFIGSLTLFGLFMSQEVNLVLRIIGVVGLGVSVLATSRFDQASFLAIMWILFSAMIAVMSREYYLFDIAVLMVAARSVDLKKLLKAFLVVTTILTILTVGSAIFNIIESPVFTTATRIRYALGFNWPSFLPHLFFFVTMTVVVVTKERFNHYWVIGFWTLNAIVYLFTDTRNAFYLSTLFLICVWLFNTFEVFKKAVIKFAPLFIYSFVLASLAIVTVSYFYDQLPMLEKLNAVLSNRLQLANNAFHEFGITALGRPIKMVGNLSIQLNSSLKHGSYNYIDSAYIQTLIIHGWLYFGCLLTLLTVTLRYLLSVKSYYWFFALVFVAIHAMVDPQLLMMWYSPLLLVVGKVFNVKGDRHRS